MQIACPNCNARYLAPDAQIGPNGRKVRCARCAHVWRVEPPPLEEQPSPSFGGLPEEPAVEAPPHPIRIDPLPRNRLPAPWGRERRRVPYAGWLALGMFVLALAVAFVLGRETLMRVWPPSEVLYRAVGIVAAAPASAPTVKDEPLRIDALKSDWVKTDAGSDLVMSGNVVNAADEAKAAPYVRIRLYNDGQQIVRDQRTVVEGGPIAPGEQRPFVMRFENPEGVARAIPLLEPVR